MTRAERIAIAAQLEAEDQARREKAQARKEAETRDAFAKAALAGLLACPMQGDPGSEYDPFKDISERAYRYADAMLEARKEAVNG